MPPTQEDAEQAQQAVEQGQTLLIENLLLRVDREAEAAAEETQANDALDDVDSANSSPSVRVCCILPLHTPNRLRSPHELSHLKSDASSICRIVSVFRSERCFRNGVSMEVLKISG